MDNNFFTVQFKDDNSIVVSFNFPDPKPNCYYHIIIEDDKGDIYVTTDIKNYFWYKYVFNKFFKYHIKLLCFDGETVEMIDEKIFDKRNHKFLMSLKSDNEQEIRIWKDYLKLIESSLEINFDYLINGDLPEPDKILDTVEISKTKYEIFLRGSNRPLTNDFSSLTIIKTLFDIL